MFGLLCDVMLITLADRLSRLVCLGNVKKPRLLGRVLGRGLAAGNIVNTSHLRPAAGDSPRIWRANCSEEGRGPNPWTLSDENMTFACLNQGRHFKS